MPPNAKTKPSRYPVTGAGLGFRMDLIDQMRANPPRQVDFMEIAPENWIRVGGARGKYLREFTERYPFVGHGLSLSIGGPDALDETFLHKLRRFLDKFDVPIYSEHLSYCTDGGHLYDLMPIPFADEAVQYVAGRVRRVQEILGRRIALENVSYYAAPHQELREIDFVRAVLEESDCDLLLDVNNIYVNSVNHRYDAIEYLHALPAERVRYIHVAGHYREAEDLIVDTHGAAVVDPVWALLDAAYAHVGVQPTLLERDFNIPAMEELAREIAVIRGYQRQHASSATPTRHAVA